MGCKQLISITSQREEYLTVPSLYSSTIGPSCHLVSKTAMDLTMDKYQKISQRCYIDFPVPQTALVPQHALLPEPHLARQRPRCRPPHKVPTPYTGEVREDNRGTKGYLNVHDGAVTQLQPPLKLLAVHNEYIIVFKTGTDIIVIKLR